MKVINLYGGAGSGKSTNAAGLFYEMKVQGYNVELVTEFAKDLTYGGQINLLLDQQEYIFAEQNYRLHRLRTHVDFAITDSPITIGAVYAQQSYPIRDLFCDFVFATYGLYDNVNIMLKRPKTGYSSVGRNQDLPESQIIDDQIRNMLIEQKLQYTEIQAGPNTVNDMMEIVSNLD